MTEPFDPAKFVNMIGQKLVMEFEHAGTAGTPGLIGTARENPARIQLAKVLRGFVSAGSGIVIDSFGGQSRQQDIVFFERDFCPVYSINDTPEATYFPVEGVIAVGEVKSVVDKTLLFDALDKIRSTKVLKRFSESIDDGFSGSASFRPYGTGMSVAGGPQEGYNQSQNTHDQVFAFLICKSFRNSPDAVLANLVEYCATHGAGQLPNFIVSLDNGFIQGIDIPTLSLQESTLTGNGVAFVPDLRSFTFLVQALQQHVRNGRTVPTCAFNRYMASLGGKLPKVLFHPFPLLGPSPRSTPQPA